MYVDYAFYKTLYGTTVDDKVFNRLIWNAEKLVKNAVTGVDGRCKLDFAFPDVAYDSEAVKRCECALVNIMAKIEKAETEAEGNKTVKSVSAGNESISYDTGSGLICKVLSPARCCQCSLILRQRRSCLYNRPSFKCGRWHGNVV